MKIWKVLGLAAILAVGTTGLTSASGVAASGAAHKQVTLVWWHNATQGAGLKLWTQVAAEFHKLHPDVTIKAVPIQNEQFTTKIPIALQSSNPPDVFQNWGGGQLVDQVKAHKVANLTRYVSSWIKNIGGSAAGWQVNGQQYAIPYNVGVVGFWYNKSLFTKAGISSPPTTWPQFLSDVKKLKEAGITPIAIGSKDRWPDAFYWDYLAVKLCSKPTIQQSAVTYNFKNPCWLQAGNYTQQLLDAEPFQSGFLATPAQQGATSSAGMLANGKAAMELQGHWNPGVMESLTPDQKIPSFLGWFPFPNVPGSKALPGSLLGGGDGFACSAKAPQPACAQFLGYIDSMSVQRRIGSTNFGLPVLKGSESSVKDPNLRTVLKFRSSSPFVQLYLDIAFSQSIGQALDSAVADMFAGQANSRQVLQQIVDAATKK
ncbi:MAG TPA: extracellular solute-binding protein, partial [Gaiellaceae bacterium]|jgi:raffinose/stachyose/melibiose transport system substrate-binding protein